jgi:hypothetical protein
MRGAIFIFFAASIFLSATMTEIVRAGQEATNSSTEELSASYLLQRYSADGQKDAMASTTPFDGGELQRGAECPSGSGRYCSNALPYCCRSASGSVYCAPNAGAC